MKFTSFARLFDQGRRQTRRSRLAARSRLRWRVRFEQPQLESLEDRTLLSVLPTPQVSNQGLLPTTPIPTSTPHSAIGSVANERFSSSAIAVDPLDPNDLVAVYSLSDDTDTVIAQTLPIQQHSFIVGAYSTDGGQSWSQLNWATPTVPPLTAPHFIITQLNLLDPNPTNPPNTNRGELQDATDPSIAFDRNHNVYVVYSESSRDHQFGAIVMSKFNFPDQGVPLIQTLVDPTTVFLSEYQFTQPLYYWGFQGTDTNGLGWDAIYNPTVTVDNNLPSYKDPITGAVQTDPFAGTIYVAFNTNFQPPPNVVLNPNTIQVMASSDGGLSFSTPKYLNAHDFIEPRRPGDRLSSPRLAVSQGTSNLRPTIFGQVTGGLLTGVWNNFGLGNTISTESVGNGGFSDYASGNLLGVCAGGTSGMSAYLGNYCDAVHPMMGNGDIPTATTFNLNTPVSLPSDAVHGTMVTGINVTLDMEDIHLDDSSAELVAPGGNCDPMVGPITGCYVLFNNHVNPDGTTNGTTAFPIGFNQVGAGRNLGLSTDNAAGHHFATTFPPPPVDLWDAVFDPLVVRFMNQTNPTNSGPYVGHYVPELPLIPLGINPAVPFFLPTHLPVAAVNGNWQLIITNYRDNSMETNHFQRIWKWGITFTQGLTTPDERGVRNDLNINTTNDAAVVGAEYSGAKYPLKPPSNPNIGIGPTPSIASDNTLGNFSPYQGRLYVAFTGKAAAGKIAPSGGANDTDIYLYFSDDGGRTWFPWQAGLPVNDDSATDGFSQGNRTQFGAQVAVDQYTGTVALTYRDARYDAANARVVTTLATSNDGGRTFQNAAQSQGQQIYLNRVQQAVDAITGKTVAIQPLPDNQAAGGGMSNPTFGFGDYTGLAVADGHVYPIWSGDANGNILNSGSLPNLFIYTAQVAIAVGPRVVGSTMGPVAKASEFQLQDGTTPVPYNATFSADGTQMVDGFVITFDRPIADGRMGQLGLTSYNHGMPTLSPSDIQVIFHDTVTPQSQLGVNIPVLSITPLFDTDPNSPLWSLAVPSTTNPAALAQGRPLMLLAEQEFGANKFLVRIQPQSRIGTYSYVVGPNSSNPGPKDLIRSPLGDPNGIGNLMDQNANASAGELPTAGSGGDTFADPTPVNNGPNFLAPYNQLTLPIIVSGPHILNTFVSGSPPSADNLVSSGLANSVDIVFDRDMDPNTLNAQTVLRMVGPAGAILGPFTIMPDPTPNYQRLINGNLTSGPDPDVTHPRTYKITFPPQQLNGTYTINLASTIRSAHGDMVDTNQNAGVDILRDIPSGGTRDVTYNNLGTFTSTPTTITAPIDVTDNFVIQAITLGLTLNTNDVRDLSAYLQAPDGTRIQLFTNVGGGGTSFVNFTHTIFSDSATGGPGSPTNPIQGGQAPFTGTYNPQQPLSTLVGKASVGRYQLVITSKTSITGHQTQLITWSLTLTRPIPITGLGELVADQNTVNFRLFSLAKSDPVSTKTWTAVGPAGIGSVDPVTGQATPSTHSSRIAGIAVDPSDPSGNTAYIAGASGGVWKTTNFLTTAPGGPTYVPLTDTAPTFGLNIGNITVFPRNNDPKQSIIFLATGEGDSLLNAPLPGVGFLRSLDGGGTWTLLDSSNNNLAYAQRDHVFVGTSAYQIVADPTPNPSGQTILYAAISGGVGSSAGAGGIWRSTDTGNTWTLLRSGNATSVVLAAGSADSNSGNLRIVYGAFRGDGVYISVDAGNRWNQMAGGAGLLWFDFFRAGSANPYVTVNAPPATPNGAKGRITLAAPALVPATVPNSRLQNLLYQGWLYALVSTSAGREDGLYVTKDFGQNWTQIKITQTPPPAGFIGPTFPTNDQNGNVLDLLGSAFAPQGNYNQSLVVDPTNPNVVYVGGTRDNNPTTLIRVDTTGMADARNFLPHNNLLNDGGQLEGATTGPTVIGGGAGAQEGPYGIIDPTQLALGFVALYAPLNTGYLNLLNDPYNPFLFNSTIEVANLAMNGTILSQSNSGVQVKWLFYDAAVDSGTIASTDQHRVVAMIDPLTGKTRLIFGDDQGLFSVVDPGDGTTNFITGIGTATANADASRNGNLQINQFYGGASQPSQLAANIAGALLYAEAQDNGFPLSDANLLKNGNIQWTGPDGDGQWVGTDQTGSGSVYESRWPCCQGGENAFGAVDTDFFRFNRNTGRTFGLFNPPPDRANWPEAGSFNAAVNPVNGNQLVISSAIGNVFRTDSGGFQWFLIGNGAAELDGSNAQALAYGAPDPRDPIGATDDFIWAGTVKGGIWVTLDGGGHWTKLSAGLDGSSVQAIVTNPHRGTHEAYAVTSTGVFHITFNVILDPTGTNRLIIDQTAGAPTWQNITGNLFNLTHTSLSDPTQVFMETLLSRTGINLRLLTTMVADWRFAILDNPANPTGPTHPVLYVGSDSGVFRSLDNGTTWTIFPNIVNDGAATVGGYLPRVRITHLDLAIGDINPQTGLPLSATSPDLLFATTYGRGMFAIRIPAPQATEEVFVVGLNNRVYGQQLDSRGNPGGPYFQTSVDQVKSIVTGHDAAGRPLVFALGLDNQVYFQRFDLNGNPLGDFAATAVGAIKTYTISTDANGNPELFVIGLNDNVFALNFDANDNPVGGYFLTAIGAVKSMAVSHDTQGIPELFVIGLDNQVYYRRFDVNGQPLPDGGYFLTQAGQVKSISVGQNSTNQPEVFAIGLDNQVYGQRFDDNGRPATGAAAGWFLAVSPPGGGARQVKSLTVGHDANNNPMLFVTGLNDNIFLAALDATGSPLAPDYSLAALGAVKDFEMGYDANNIPEIFAIGLDDQVYYDLFNPPGSSTGAYHLMNPGRVKSLTVTK